MNACSKLLIAGLFLATNIGTPATSQPLHEPTRVIFDTDMWGDIDDVLALAMLNALQDRGEAKILAVTGSTDDKWSASFINLFEAFYGHPEMPVGLVRHGVSGNTEWMGPYRHKPNYTQYVAELRSPSGHFLFPHRLVDGSRAPRRCSIAAQNLGRAAR
jgi:hypothetical protein